MAGGPQRTNSVGVIKYMGCPPALVIGSNLLRAQTCSSSNASFFCEASGPLSHCAVCTSSHGNSASPTLHVAGSYLSLTLPFRPPLTADNQDNGAALAGWLSSLRRLKPWVNSPSRPYSRLILPITPSTMYWHRQDHRLRRNIVSTRNQLAAVADHANAQSLEFQRSQLSTTPTRHFI